MTTLANKTSLANKTALVTGASRGMGRATALALAAAGARVIVHYGRNADEAKAVVDQIRAAGGRADAVAADLAAADGAHTLAAQVRNLIGDRLDIVVSNAGISKAAAIEDMTVEDFDNLFAVNVRAPYLLVQQLLPMLGSGSTIVFLSSLGARTAVGTLAAYASTKGAINTLVKYFAAALGQHGIRVNAVAPGVIDTDMSNFTKTEEGRAVVMGMQSLKRIGTPADVASVIAFLVSDEARWSTAAPSSERPPNPFRSAMEHKMSTCIVCHGQQPRFRASPPGSPPQPSARRSSIRIVAVGPS
jgi:3-oxoacyl-[acyl-carrier protein] reductase